MRQLVCTRRQPSVDAYTLPRAHVGRARSLCAWLFALLFASLSVACGQHPEDQLVGRWQELNWHYEKFDGYHPEQAKWIDGVQFQDYADRRIVRHEAEYWDFRPGGALVISKRDGSEVRARWRLKGRGHVLTVRFEDGALEVYDVKTLDGDALVLNFDIGMEVRGIAQLTFGRLQAPESAFASEPLANHQP